MNAPLNHILYSKKVQEGNDQERALSERNSHSNNRGGENLIELRSYT